MLHVAVPVTKLVPLDEAGHPTGVPFVERKNSDLAESDLTSMKTIACAAKCAKLNPECVEEQSRLQARRRLLIF